MSRLVFENEEFLIEDSEGVGFFLPENSGYHLGRRLTEKKTGRAFYVDRDSFRVFEQHDGTLFQVTDDTTLKRLDAQKGN